MSIKKRSNFDLSHEVKTSTDIGKLVPIFCEPIIPGDSFKISTEVYARFAPLLAPIMHRVNCYVHWFFVPNRLLWKEWRKFITGGPKGNQNPVYPRVKVPVAELNKSINQYWLNKWFGRNSLYDYLGFPTYIGYQGGKYINQFLNATRDLEIDLLPFMAYQRIWADYYRDENLDSLRGFYYTDEEFDQSDENELPLLESGIRVPEESSSAMPYDSVLDQIFSLRQRCWEKDYFTSALPWAQRGGDVIIPGTGNSVDPSSLKIGTNKPTAEVPITAYQANFDQPSIGFMGSDQYYDIYQDQDNIHNLYAEASGQILGNPATFLHGSLSAQNAMIGTADLANALSIIESGAKLDPGVVDEGTINNLRRANALQKYLEAMARGGSRYIEQIQTIFGVRSSDSRLQRAEYLGGGRTNVIISEVLQQSADAETPAGDPSPLGEFAGRGLLSGSTNSFKRFFEEHGYLVGVMSIVPRSSYCQGTPRKYTKFDRFDYLIPHFAHLGEQEVKNSEVYDSLTLADEVRNGTFGYQSRYAEYKFIPSRVTAEMRDRLDFWHLTRKFTSLPGLNDEFVKISPEETSRIYAVQEETEVDAATGEPVTDADGVVQTVPTDHIFTQIYIHAKAKRELPRYGTPEL